MGAVGFSAKKINLAGKGTVVYRRHPFTAKGIAVNITAKKDGTGKWAKIRAFLEKKGITLSPKVYFVDAMGAMALGLFATLLIGNNFRHGCGLYTRGRY